MAPLSSSGIKSVQIKGAQIFAQMSSRLQPQKAMTAQLLPPPDAAPPAQTDDDPNDPESVALRALLALRKDSWCGPSWALDGRLAAQLAVPLPELIARIPTLDSSEGRRAEPGEWATGLVLAYLQIRFYEKSSTWAPTVVVRKNAIPAISMHVLTTAPGPLPHR
jgi:hypothetical protein